VRRLRRKTYLVTYFLILGSSFVMPILGLQSSSLKMLSQGMVKYPERELGVWHQVPWLEPPDEATWMTFRWATEKSYKAKEHVRVILNWVDVHTPWNDDGTANTFKTENDIKTVETAFKTVPTGKFWGVIFICEEHWRMHIAFDDDVNTTWFNEQLLGHPLYLVEVPGATKEDWIDEMYLRMIRGFYNYFHYGRGMAVGITANGVSLIPNWKNRPAAKGLPYYYGEPAMVFIKEYYDFVILYAYTVNLEDFQSTKQYFSLIDQLFQKHKKFWILTRIFDNNRDVWELEVTALEIKNCLDRGIVITCYYWNEPPFNETWPLIKKAIKLYDSRAPYFESYINGKNMLTGYVGNTYGWVEV